MDDQQTLSIVVKLQDQASAALEQMAAKAKAMGENVGKGLESIGAKMSSIGTSVMEVGDKMSKAGHSMSVGLTLPIVAFGHEVLDAGLKFGSTMQLVSSQAGATAEEVKKMTAAVLELSKSGEVGQGPEKLAEGLVHVESLGYRGAEAMEVLKVSAQAADLGLADMETVTSALGGALVSGIKGAEGAAGAMGLLNATIGQGNMKMQDLVNALGTGILPAAKNFGLSLQDVGAALATLTDNGMDASSAATNLRMTFALIAAPTEEAAKAFKMFGLSQFQLADDMRTGGIVKAVTDLNEHMKKSGFTATEQAAVISKAFGGGQSSAAILTLLQQADRLKTKFDEVGKSAGDFADKVKENQETPYFKLQATLAKMQSTLIDIANSVMPIFQTALEKVNTAMAAFSEWWNHLSPAMQKGIAYFAMFLAVLGPVLSILGSIVTVVGGAISAFGAISSALGAASIAASGFGAALIALAPEIILIGVIIGVLAFAAYEVYKHWDTVASYLRPLFQTIASAWEWMVNTIQSIWDGVCTAIANFFGVSMEQVKSTIYEVVRVAMAVISPLLTLIGAIVKFVGKEIVGIQADVTSAAKNMSTEAGAGLMSVATAADKINKTAAVTAPIITGSSDAYKRMSQEGKKASEEVSKGAEAMVTELGKVKDAIVDANGALQDMQKQMNDLDVGQALATNGTAEDVAQAYVDQKKKIEDMKQDINSAQDDVWSQTDEKERNKAQAKLDKLKADLKKEQAALDAAGTIKVAYGQRIANIEAEQNKTVFQQTIDRLQVEQAQYTIAYSQKMEILAKEYDAKLKQRDALIKLEQDLTEAGKIESGKRLEAIVKDTDKLIDQYNKLYQAAVRAYSVGGSVNLNYQPLNISSSLPKHEAGGFVNAPRGTAVPIMAHGGEQIIPAEQVGAGSNGSVTIVINNPVVRNSTDLANMKKMLDEALRPLLRNSKIAHV